MKRLSQKDFNYMTGTSDLKRPYNSTIVRKYFNSCEHFTVFCSHHVLFDVNGMQFKLDYIEKEKRTELHQVGFYKKNCGFIDTTSDLFKRIKKHGDFLLNHYGYDEIARLSKYYSSLPPIDADVYDEFRKVKNRIFRIERLFHKYHWHNCVNRYNKLNDEKNRLNELSKEIYFNGL